MSEKSLHTAVQCWATAAKIAAVFTSDENSWKNFQGKRGKVEGHCSSVEKTEHWHFSLSIKPSVNFMTANNMSFTPIFYIPKLCYTPALGPKCAYSWYLGQLFPHKYDAKNKCFYEPPQHPFLSVFLFRTILWDNRGKMISREKISITTGTSILQISLHLPQRCFEPS